MDSSSRGPRVRLIPISTAAVFLQMWRKREGLDYMKVISGALSANLSTELSTDASDCLIRFFLNS